MRDLRDTPHPDGPPEPSPYRSAAGRGYAPAQMIPYDEPTCPRCDRECRCKRGTR